MKTSNNEASYRKIQGILGDQSYSLILPKHFATQLGIKKGDYVKVMQVDDKIVIKRAEE